MERSYLEMLMSVFKWAPTYVKKTKEKFINSPGRVKKSKYKIQKEKKEK